MQAPLPPIVYRQSRVAAVLYAIPLGLARQQLAGTGLLPVNFAGFGVVNAAWFDYGTSSIGAYREFSLGVMASAKPLRFTAAAQLLLGKAGPVGAYIVALPVDSELARSGGVELYGLPKTLVGFALDWSTSKLDAVVTDAGRQVFSMQLPLGFGIPVWLRQLVIYSKRDEQLLTTSIATRLTAQIDLVGRPRLAVEDRSHPLGQLLTQLGLESARSLGTLHGRLRFATLPPPPMSPKAPSAPNTCK
jgi:hypothetical protein